MGEYGCEKKEFTSEVSIHSNFSLAEIGSSAWRENKSFGIRETFMSFGDRTEGFGQIERSTPVQFPI
jgi:hypothetical protein